MGGATLLERFHNYIRLLVRLQKEGEGTHQMNEERYEAIYARQSLDKKDSVSIETQIELCEKKLTEGARSKVYQDKGYSGSTTKRPDFERLQRDIRKGKVSKVICYKLDRISRSVLDFNEFWQEMEANNVDFVSATENFDTTTPMGKSMLQISSVFAELERNTIILRVRDNYYARTKQNGTWPGGPAPYGFKNDSLNGRKTLTPVAEELDAVKMMFSTYVQPEMSLGRLAKLLEDEGVERRSGTRFDNTSLGRLLHNPVYVKADAKLYNFFVSQGAEIMSDDIDDWDGSRAAHIISKRIKKTVREEGTNTTYRQRKPLSECRVYLTNFDGTIDSELYIQANLKLAANKQLKRSGQGRLGWLGGLLKCGRCGYAIKVYSVPYLACYGRYSLGTCSASFSAKNTTIQGVQAKVAEQIQRELSMWDDYVERVRAANSEIDRAIEAYSEQIRLIYELPANTAQSRQIQAARLASLEQQILDAEQQKNTAVYVLGEDSGQIEFDMCTEERKREIAHVLIDRVLLYPDGNVEVKWKRNAYVEDTEDIDTEALTGAVDNRERSEGEAAGQTVGRIQRKELDGETYMDVELLH